MIRDGANGIAVTLTGRSLAREKPADESGSDGAPGIKRDRRGRRMPFQRRSIFKYDEVMRPYGGRDLSGLLRLALEGHLPEHVGSRAIRFSLALEAGSASQRIGAAAGPVVAGFAGAARQRRAGNGENRHR